MTPARHLRFGSSEGRAGFSELLWHRSEWKALGSKVSVQLLGSERQAQELIAEAHQWLYNYEQQVSRFLPYSDTSKINQQSGQKIKVGEYFLQTLQSSIWAAELTKGIVDPLIGQHLISNGYDQTFSKTKGLVSWEKVWKQPLHLAAPNNQTSWRQIQTGEDCATIPEGYSYDPGGVGKGWAADYLVNMLSHHSRAVLVDLGGDIAVRAGDGITPFPVDLSDPRSDEVATTAYLGTGAVATSSCCKRIWLQDGKPVHHLLSPADGQPIWSGLAGVSAFAPTALEAEIRAKWTLLTGEVKHLSYGGYVYPSNPEDKVLIVREH